MSEAQRYKAIKLKTEAGNIITYTPHGPDFVPAEAYDQLRAELAALKAGQGEAVATISWQQPSCEWTLNMLCEPAVGEGIDVPLYFAPRASADAVSVPVELLELEWLEGWLRFAAEPIGQECCGRGGQECCGCPDPVYPGLEDVGRAMDERAKELRALLAQSESKAKP